MTALAGHLTSYSSDCCTEITYDIRKSYIMLSMTLPFQQIIVDNGGHEGMKQVLVALTSRRIEHSGSVAVYLLGRCSRESRSRVYIVFAPGTYSLRISWRAASLNVNRHCPENEVKSNSAMIDVRANNFHSVSQCGRQHPFNGHQTRGYVLFELVMFLTNQEIPQEQICIYRGESYPNTLEMSSHQMD